MKKMCNTCRHTKIPGKEASSPSASSQLDTSEAASMALWGLLAADFTAAGALFVSAGEVAGEGSADLAEEGPADLDEEGTADLADGGTSDLAEAGTADLAEEGTADLAEEGTADLAEEGTADLAEEGAGGLAEAGDSVLESGVGSGGDPNCFGRDGFRLLDGVATG